MARYRRRGVGTPAGIPNPNYYNPRATVDPATGSVLTAAGSVNPNFGNTTAGRRQAAQEQESLTQAQLREIQQQALGMGAQVNPQASPEARAERQRQQAVGQDIAQSIGAISPFAGILGPRGVQRAVGQVAGDVFSEQRRLRQADRDATAIVQGMRNGTLDERQVSGAIDQYEAEYGNLGLRAPSFQELAGVQDTIREEQEVRLQQFAADRGLERRFVAWDDRQNRPTFNTSEFAVEKGRAEINKLRAEPQLQALKEMQRSADDFYKSELKIIEKKNAALADINPVQAVQVYDADVKAAFARRQEAMGQSATPQQSTQAPATPPAHHPKLPTGVNVVGDFADVTEVKAASPRPGSYFMLGGRLTRVNMQGNYEEVQ